VPLNGVIHSYAIFIQPVHDAGNLLPTTRIAVTYPQLEPSMHRFGFPELLIIVSILVILFIVRRPRRPPGPPRIPRHPLPAQELLQLFVRRRGGEYWHL